MRFYHVSLVFNLPNRQGFCTCFFVRATDLFETSLLIMPVSLVFQLLPCLSVLEVLCCELFGVSGRRSV